MVTIIVAFSGLSYRPNSPTNYRELVPIWLQFTQLRSVNFFLIENGHQESYQERPPKCCLPQELRIWNDGSFHLTTSVRLIRRTRTTNLSKCPPLLAVCRRVHLPPTNRHGREQIKTPSIGEERRRKRSYYNLFHLKSRVGAPRR